MVRAAKLRPQLIAYACALSLGTSFLSISPAAAAGLEDKHQFAIDAQAVDVALVTFSRQANVQLITASADLRNLKTKGVSGNKSIDSALQELLAGTGLTFRVIGENTIAIDSMG